MREVVTSQKIRGGIRSPGTRTDTDRLPDRESVKVTFTADADLKATLNDYAEIYRRAYGQKESVADLIPFMLEAFMNANPGFKRARKKLDETRPSSPATQPKET